MTKEQMISKVIRRYGFENKWTIWFCELVQILTEEQLLNALILLDNNRLIEDPDDVTNSED